MATRIDHFMYAVSSLDDGIAWATDSFGIAPAYGGEHVGRGTRNALLSLDSTYLEIIAPDPAQPLAGTLGERFAELSAGGLVTWAAEGNLTEISANLAAIGLETRGPNQTQRRTADGGLLIWELLFPSGSPHGGRMPFFIDWLDCANPKDTNPTAGEFQSLAITTRNAEDLSDKLSAVGLNLSVEEGEPALEVTVAVGDRRVVLEATDETLNLRMG